MEDWKITDLEKKLIATILFSDAFDIAERNEIQSLHFTNETRRNLFAKMEEMHKEGKSVSSDLVFLEIKNIGVSSQDFFDIVKTETDIHFSSNLEAFCEVIKLEYKKRKMHNFLLSSAKKIETEGIKAVEEITLNFTTLEKETSNSTIKKVSELQPVLNLLIERNYLREMKDETKSRPGRKSSPVFLLNPLTHITHITQNSPEVMQ